MNLGRRMKESTHLRSAPGKAAEGLRSPRRCRAHGTPCRFMAPTRVHSPEVQAAIELADGVLPEGEKHQ